MQRKEELETEKYIRWFSEFGKKDVKLVGGKAANLGEMSRMGLPVPPGFSITSEAYSYFLQETKLDKLIYSLLKNLDIENTEKLNAISKQIRKLIEEAEMPKDLQEEISEAYENLSVDKDSFKNASHNVMSIMKLSDPIFVAVRSSATAEDSSEASFAGQQETFLNVKGKTELINKVKKCFSSLFTPRSIYYRIKKGFEHENVLNSVIVQVMINSDKSGVIFSKDPLGQNENVIIEAVFGLGEGIVSGKIKPDHYVVSREEKIIKKEVSDKKIAIVRDSSGKTETKRLGEEARIMPVLNNYEIKKLANYAIKLEEHYELPQDIEFAIDSQEIYIVQTRPITTIKSQQEKKEELEGEAILTGQGASPGIGIGEVKIIKNLSDLEKIRKGDVLVTEMTNPDMVVGMQKSVAIITNEGGMTSHAAIVSREMGIPCIVGTEQATLILKEGQTVTVDGFNGKVYNGKVEELKDKKVEIFPIVNTKTKIKVMVDLPSFAERAAKTKCKEIGLVRLEGLIAESGKHPLEFLKSGNIEEYEKIIFSGLSKISEHFNNIWVRTSDIRTDEFKNLEGAPFKQELNPMLGFHGIRFSLKNPGILKAELKAMSKILEKGKKIEVMLPQVISVSEVEEVKKIIENMKLNLKLGVMIETPAAVEIIEDLCKKGIEFISFGTNDLTQYTLAIDRGNEDVQYLYDEMHPAVLSQLKHVIQVCKKYNVKTSICGQAGSKKEMVEFLVKLGIDSISVNADKANEISEFVKKLEDKGLRESKSEEEIQDIEEEIEEDSEIGEKKGYKEIIDEKGRKSYEVKCDDCGNIAKVPFKPAPGREVYCKECYELRKSQRQKSEKTAETEEESLNNSNQEENNEEDLNKEIEEIEESIEEMQEIEEAQEEMSREGVYNKVENSIDNINDEDNSEDDSDPELLDIF